MVGEFNIIAGYPGKTLGVNRYMSWSQIGTMAARGWRWSRTLSSHQDLGLLRARAGDLRVALLARILAHSVHRAVQFLTYPSGEPFRSGSMAAQRRILSLLARYGYIGALLDPVVPGTRQEARAPYQLMRRRVSNNESLSAFAAGLHN